ncbi:hypothetical protein DFA_09169 [Cavenderia fasciculata]|uniref:Uncharacterized protein n=1 Tax=Cavenderia fasciculata TaxID=261658 RepID=F4Q6W2_CACFS|nr:uncharacterized protein DFA_09169 [Cavenderia fasciculata]EGG16144.1 hypothetical protein DFA_09169 [Cavenderia fasciculata]|eukprot:XP_004352597.1 hypothetical protein DFA_09169 [Cavenderia fasciculata]
MQTSLSKLGSNFSFMMKESLSSSRSSGGHHSSMNTCGGGAGSIGIQAENNVAFAKPYWGKW